MKSILCSLLIVLALSSCSSTYFYTTLETVDEYIDKVDNGDFLLENDTLWIAHCFKGENAPMQITIFNKSEKPIYVDWNRSAIIIDNKAYTYGGQSLSFSGIMSGETLKNRNSELSFGGFEGVLERADNLTFVPPQTMISEVPFVFRPSFKHLDKDIYKPLSISDKNNNVVPAQRVDFEVSDTPLFFRSYLTIYTEPDKPVVFDQAFYVSNITKTSIKPQNMPGNLMDRGDVFYLYQPANNDPLYITLGVVAIGGIVAASVAYGADVDDGYEF